jgi:hypothetical protein
MRYGDMSCTVASTIGEMSLPWFDRVRLDNADLGMARGGDDEGFCEGLLLVCGDIGVWPTENIRRGDDVAVGSCPWDADRCTEGGTDEPRVRLRIFLILSLTSATSLDGDGRENMSRRGGDGDGCRGAFVDVLMFLIGFGCWCCWCC